MIGRCYCNKNTDRVESLSHRGGRIKRDHVLLYGLDRWRSKTLLTLGQETGSLRNETGRLRYETRCLRKETGRLWKKTSSDRDLSLYQVLLVQDRILCLESRDAVIYVRHKLHNFVLKQIWELTTENYLFVLTTGQKDRSLTSFPESFEFDEEKLLCRSCSLFFAPSTMSVIVLISSWVRIVVLIITETTEKGDIKYWPGITTVSTGILLSLWTLFCCLCFSQCRKCFRNAPFVSTDSRVRQRWHGVLVSHTTPLWSLICLKHLTCPKDQFTLHISLSHSLSEHPLLHSS